LHLVERWKEAEESYYRALKLSSGNDKLAKENLRKLDNQLKINEEND